MVKATWIWVAVIIIIVIIGVLFFTRHSASQQPLNPASVPSDAASNPNAY